MAKDFKTYSEKLKDPRWQKKRLEILERDNWSCRYCGDKESTLHVHHEHYIKGCEPWEADECSLTTLCEDCHSTTHLAKTLLEKFLLEGMRVRMKEEGMTVKDFNRIIRSVVDGAFE